MNGFGCCRHKLLTSGPRVNRDLSPGLESFRFTRHFSEMNGLPPLYTVGAAGRRCQMLQRVCACVCLCVNAECVHVSMCLCVVIP